MVELFTTKIIISNRSRSTRRRTRARSERSSGEEEKNERDMYKELKNCCDWVKETVKSSRNCLLGISS